MKGYKAFDPGMICRGKKYKENTVFEEPEAVICEKGMHFCANPMDVLRYYPLVNVDGEFSDFAEVESLDEPITDNGIKFVSKKLRVGVKLNFKKFIDTSAEFLIQKTDLQGENSSGDCAQIGSSGNHARISSSGYSAQIGSSGDYAQIGSSGNYARIGSSGYSAQIGSSGNHAQIGSSGNYAKIGSSGDYAQIGSSGYSAQIGSSGDYAQIGSSGSSAKIGSSGNSAQIGSSGSSAQIGSSGDYAQIGSSGNYAKIGSSGERSVICCAGHGSCVKAKKGSWITLSEWGNDKGEYIPLCVKTEYVDGERIKENVFYKLENGEFVEA